MRNPKGLAWKIITTWFRRLKNRAARDGYDKLIDPLTGLANRAAFTNFVTHALARGEPCGLILVDLDGFRAIRNFHGRGPARALLRDVGARLAKLITREDIAARLQGDEFAVLVKVQTAAALQTASAGMLSELKSAYYPDGKHCDVSLSIGAAMLPAAFLPAQGATVEAAMGAASLALENAKSAGGGACRMFDNEMAVLSLSQHALKRELQPALAAGQFIPYYQPIVDLKTGAVCGFEVLARWAHPQRGLLAPIEFIDMAEKQNLCAQLSGCLLRQVIHDQRNWPQHWRFAFNTVPGQLRELVDFISKASGIPGQRIDPRRVDLEITENALISDLDLARKVVKAMHAVGAKVVLDDFGIGYANFLHLREIPFDRIKIDKSFVMDMLTDSRAKACVHAMLALSQSLGVAITAEGVESQEVADSLRAMGCTHAQGYFYARPLPATDVDMIALRSVHTAAAGAAPQEAACSAGFTACSCDQQAYLRPPCNTISEAATTP